MGSGSYVIRIEHIHFIRIIVFQKLCIPHDVMRILPDVRHDFIRIFFLFNEILTIVAFMGVVITLTGVVVVLLEDEALSDETRLTKKEKVKGVSLAFVGAMGQGLGLAFLKKGMLLYPNVTGIYDVISLAIQNRLTLKSLAKLSYSAQPWQSFFPARSAIVEACENALEKFSASAKSSNQESA